MGEGVGVLILNPKNQVLLQLRDKKEGILNPGVWALPGGLLYKNETVVRSAKREVYEETGLYLNQVRILGKKFFPDQKRWVYICFSRIDNKRPGCYEGQKMEYKNFWQIWGLKMAPGYKILVLVSMVLGSILFNEFAQVNRPWHFFVFGDPVEVFNK